MFIEVEKDLIKALKDIRECHLIESVFQEHETRFIYSEWIDSNLRDIGRKAEAAISEAEKKINAIMIDGNALDLQDVERQLNDDMKAEQLGRLLAHNLRLKQNKNLRYDIEDGDKTNIGLAKTILRWIKEYFD